MKNFMVRRNNEDYGDLDFFGREFDDLFRPMFYENEHHNMKTDIRETENSYEVAVDLAGFDKKDINVKLENGYVTISAKREDKHENKRYLRRERSVSCSRSYYVGDKVKESDIKAKYENGTLTVEIPKKEEKQIASHNIEIE